MWQCIMGIMLLHVILFITPCIYFNQPPCLFLALCSSDCGRDSFHCILPLLCNLQLFGSTCSTQWRCDLIYNYSKSFMFQLSQQQHKKIFKVSRVEIKDRECHFLLSGTELKNLDEILKYYEKMASRIWTTKIPQKIASQLVQVFNCLHLGST